MDPNLEISDSALDGIPGARAHLFEAQSARSIPCVCRPSSTDGIVIVRADLPREIIKYQFEEIIPMARIGAYHTTRIRFSDGVLVEIQDGDLFEILLQESGLVLPEGKAFQLEQMVFRRPIALGGSIIMLLAAITYFAVPIFAYTTAHLLPRDFFIPLGHGVLHSIDIQPSQLSAERQEAISKRFDELNEAAGYPSETPLLFGYSAEIGPNAFALPGGMVMILDDLVEVLPSEEIVAVLAHELIHAREKHAERNLIEAAGYSGIFTLLIGDFTLLADLLSTFAGAALIYDHSRAHETEADIEGAKLLREAGYDPMAMTRMLQLFQQLEGGAGYDAEESDPDEEVAKDWFSTHPDTRQRIDDVNKAIQEFSY